MKAAVLLLTLCTAAWAGTPEPQRHTESYRVNAQVRGSIQKSFEDLGVVGVVYRVTGAAKSVFAIAGKVRDPDDRSRLYRFTAEVSLERSGRHLTSRAHSGFSEDAEEYRDRILEMSPFVYLLRTEPFPPGGSGESEYAVNGKPYVVRWSLGERGPEATLYEGLRTVGKFFFRPGSPQAGPHEYEKFRVNTVRRTVLSFVRR